MEILLARHGRTDANGGGFFVGQWDVPLNATGLAQARALAAEVRDRGLARLYTSPLRRAVQTAETVAAAAGLRPVTDPRLAETDAGRWQARPRDEARARDPERYRLLRRAPERFRYPGGESLREHQERVRAALSEIAARASPALVVCHHGTIRCALALGHPRGLAAWRELDVPNASVIALPEASQAALEP